MTIAQTIRAIQSESRWRPPGYLPVHSDGAAMNIEDDRLATEVARCMIEAGVEVEEVHVD